ncbi:MAG: SHOCT domain-containing protein [Acidimicrobiales bacterium]|nr:SHOCT domain-containing protein [Acidimicrobiales bacterium]
MELHFAFTKGKRFRMVTLLGILADAGDGWDHMGGWGGGWMWLWGVAMMALFAMLLVWLVRVSGAGPASQEGPLPRDPSDRAREILAERYARGELSTEEYRERVGELQ